MPDCGGWGDSAGSDIMNLLLQAVSFAFPNDQEILDACVSTTLDEVAVTALLNKLPGLEIKYPNICSILSPERVASLRCF